MVEPIDKKEGKKGIIDNFSESEMERFNDWPEMKTVFMKIVGAVQFQLFVTYDLLIYSLRNPEPFSKIGFFEAIMFSSIGLIILGVLFIRPVSLFFPLNYILLSILTVFAALSLVFYL